MRCQLYNLFGSLPTHIEKEGVVYPLQDAEGNIVSDERLAELGILRRVDATPDPIWNIVVDSHGEMIDGQFKEVIDVQKNPQEIKDANSLLKSKFTRSDIRAAAKAIGKETELNALLSNADFKLAWDEAMLYIDFADSRTVAAFGMVGIGMNDVKIAIGNLT